MTPTAFAEGVCNEGVGGIEVGIDAIDSWKYDVYIDSVLVADDIPDTAGGVVLFEPYENGTYNVVVDWDETSGFNILDVSVEVDCVADPTPTVPDTSVDTSPDTVATTPAPAAEALTATPRFTG